jgi:hypothetical protein
MEIELTPEECQHILRRRESSSFLKGKNHGLHTAASYVVGARSADYEGLKFFEVIQKLSQGIMKLRESEDF